MKTGGTLKISGRSPINSSRENVLSGSPALANQGQGEGSSRQSSKDLEAERQMETMRKQRAKIVLWKHPLTTIHYFMRELFIETKKLAFGTLQHRVKVALFVAILTVFLLLYFLDGPLQPYMMQLELQVLWCLYWVGLGILSSVGLGTGLHTFLLYLGPFIASVTLAAFTCNSVDFPSPPYPNDIRCPAGNSTQLQQVTFWTVMAKVRLEAFMWGAGTALGELPPYFMARAASSYVPHAHTPGTETTQVSGNGEEELDYEPIEALLSSERRDPLTRAKKVIYRLVHKVGFFGILLCASIPNPLFDLAGITCGHFMVPFWTFFGATLIGKAVIKTHIQEMFVILAFSEHHFEWAVELIGNIPYVGPYIQSPFSEYLDKQKKKLHITGRVHESSRLQQIFGYLLVLMIAYFVLSIVNSMAQNYAKRLDEEKLRSRHHSKTD